jgi:hypothetical protein
MSLGGKAMTKSYFRFVLTFALALGFCLPLATLVRADHDWTNECHERLQRQKDKIDHDAARYGEHSNKVAHDVDRLEQERNWCRDHHADWDHNAFDVGIYVHK